MCSGQSVPSACCISASGRSQPEILDQVLLAGRPCAFLHITLIAISPPWVSSAVIGVPHGCMPELKSPTMWWALVQGYQQFKNQLTGDPFDDWLFKETETSSYRGRFKITFSEMQIRTLVVDTTMHDSIGIRAPYNGNTWAIYSSCNGVTTYFPFFWRPNWSRYLSNKTRAWVYSEIVIGKSFT